MSHPTQTLDEFLARYDPDGKRTVAVVDVEAQTTENGGPFIVVKQGRYAAVIAAVPCAPETYLDLDVHSFVDGQDAAGSVFGMSEGRKFKGFRDTGKTSYGLPAANLIAILIGEQGHEHCEGCGCEKEPG